MTGLIVRCSAIPKFTQLFYSKVDKVIHQTVLAKDRGDTLDLEPLLLRRTLTRIAPEDSNYRHLSCLLRNISGLYFNCHLGRLQLHSARCRSLFTQCRSISVICMDCPRFKIFGVCLVLSFTPRTQHSFKETSMVHSLFHYLPRGDFSLG